VTPREIELMREMLREEVAPIKRDLAALSGRVVSLEATDRRHSGQHRDTKAAIRQSQSDIRADVEGTVEGVKRHDERILTEIEAMRTDIATLREQGKSIAPAAKGAEDAAVAGAKASIQGAQAAIDTKLGNGKLNTKTDRITWGTAALLLLQLLQFVLAHWGGH
jgi:chromosome segregation ATPase